MTPTHTSVKAPSPAPTLLSHLNALTPSLAYPTAYLHPYAPSTSGTSGWKGKGRADPQSVQAQLEMVQAMRSCVEQTKEVLGKREGDWGKLSRAMKEVVTHQNTLSPLRSSFHPYPPLIPSSRVTLAPVQLLPALAQTQDIQTYHEDSQFGLLKATLTLAGNCFVIDIDLETDAAEEDNAPSSRPKDSEGSVRLSKLSISYVTSGEGQASEYVTGTLRTAIDEYLGEWNSVVQGLKQKWERAKRIERCIRRLEGLLGEMKALDGPIHVEGVQAEESSFAALEQVVRRIQEKIGQTIFSPEHPTICPNFRLFPQATSQPTFRIRPAVRGEDVPYAYSTDDQIETKRDYWVLEVIPEPGIDGVVVRRNWLSGVAAESPWDGGVKVENLLYKPENFSNQIHPFPYQSVFVHASPTSLEQHWSLASPGPDGYLIGCVRLPDTDEQLDQLLDAIKRQVLLNRMISRVFNKEASPQGEDEDEDLEQLLEESRAIPINVSLTQDSIILLSPVPHTGSFGSLRLEIKVNGDVVEVQSEILGNELGMKEKVMQAIKALQGDDLVDIYRKVETALRMP